MKQNKFDEAMARMLHLYHAAFCIVTGADPEDPNAFLAPTTPEQDRVIDAEFRRMMSASHESKEHVFSPKFEEAMQKVIREARRQKKRLIDEADNPNDQ